MSFIKNQFTTFQLFGLGQLLLFFSIYAFFEGTEQIHISKPAIWLFYPFSFVYFLISLWKKNDLFSKSIGLSLMYIACFSFNKQLTLFGHFSPLQTAAMITTQLTLLALPFSRFMQKRIKAILLLLAGFSWVFTLHLAIYLAPVYGIGLMACIVLGLGILVFIPLFSLIHFMRILAKQSEVFSEMRKWFWLGFLTPIVFAAVYIFYYNNFKNQLDSLSSKYEESSKILSKEMYIKQYVKFNYFDEYLISNNLPIIHHDFIFRSKGENHNPLGILAALTIGNIPLTEEQVDVIIKSLYENRHENNPRFWTGIDLTTTSVDTKIDIFPNERIAYYEKTIIVSKKSRKWWNNQQEAIYTFHLPDGAVGTSLSLWVNGIEEEAALSTKSKVENAYKSIVGIERRDPAMMTWREGNRLVVNVFPVSDTLPRKFKVGFTVPIKTIDNQCYLSPIYFQGPDWSDGSEHIELHFQGLEIPENLKNQGKFTVNNHLFTKKTEIQSSWHFTWDSQPLNSTPFVFNGNEYKAVEIESKTLDFNITDIIIDLNNLWTKNEYVQLLAVAPSSKKWAYTDDNTLVEITAINNEQIFKKYYARNFSIFSHEILAKNQLNPSSTLVVSKTQIDFPSICDINHQKRIITEPFFLYDLALSLQLSPKIYQESGLANVSYGSLNQLSTYLTNKKFPSYTQNNFCMAIPSNGTQIMRNKVDAKTLGTSSNDHLMRLFNYGLLMKEVQTFYFQRDFLIESQIKLAKDAHIVSPYSSLVSLESAADYERFAIEKPNKKSLGNANILDNGSVPEPHEWLLIMLSVLFLSFLLYKRLFR